MADDPRGSADAEDFAVAERDASNRAVKESEARYRAFVTASNDVIYRMNADWSRIRQLDGRGFVVDGSQAARNWLDHYVHPDDREQVSRAIAAAIRTRSVFELEHRVRRVDGTYGWTLSRAVPILDGKGEIREWLGTARDVTAAHETLGDLARVTADSERQKHFYETLISSTPDLVYAFDRQYRFTFANQALLTMWGRTLEDSVGKRLIEVGYEPWHAEMHEREIDTVIATKAAIRGEVGFPHATLGRRVYDYIFTPVLNDAGEVEFIAGTTRDITDIKRAEEHLKLLINELNHRVKNTLATIQSIANQTFRGGAAEPAARAAFEARLMALSEAHSLLTGANWEGAHLRDLAHKAMAPFRGEEGSCQRLRLEGDNIQLRPQAALAIAMALHELASNAVKYGALSGPAGQVTLSWTTSDGRLRIDWRESGGPPVEPPARRGFGSRLIEQGLARELDGTVSLDYRPEGVACAIEFAV